MTTIGILIKNAMNESNLNQKQLQSKTGIDQHTLSDYINDKRSPKVEDLSKISDATNKSLLELLPLDKLIISNNNYTDNASTIQNFNMVDKAFVYELMKEIVELRVKVKELENKQVM
jgi:transcriptional regulator with XRE-family HTH domain